MASEPARHALYNRLTEVLGDEHADTLIQSLPMEPAAQLAHKSDITRLESQIDRLESQIAELSRSLRDYQKTTLVTIVGAMTALTTIFSIVVGLVT
jgi:TolA-binding protein